MGTNVKYFTIKSKFFFLFFVDLLKSFKNI